MIDEQILTGKAFPLERLLYPGARLKINATICQLEDKIICVYRTDHLHSFDAKNFLTVFNADFSNGQHKQIVAANGNTAFEDIRLFNYNGQIWVMYTHLPRIGNSGWSQNYEMGIGTLNIENGLIENQQDLKAFSGRVNEKNWSPYVHQGQLFLITDFDPYLKIGIVQGDVGNLSFGLQYLSNEKSMLWPYGEVRGGTPFVSHPEGTNNNWLYAFIHSSLSLPNGVLNSRFYSCTIVRFNCVDYTLEFCEDSIDFSSPDDDPSYIANWNFSTRGSLSRVIFPAGLINYKNGVLMSYGQDDCVSRVKYYSWGTLESLEFVNTTKSIHYIKKPIK